MENSIKICIPSLPHFIRLSIPFTSLTLPAFIYKRIPANCPHFIVQIFNTSNSLFPNNIFHQIDITLDTPIEQPFFEFIVLNVSEYVSLCLNCESSLCQSLILYKLNIIFYFPEILAYINNKTNKCYNKHVNLSVIKYIMQSTYWDNEILFDANIDYKLYLVIRNIELYINKISDVNVNIVDNSKLLYLYINIAQYYCKKGMARMAMYYWVLASIRVNDDSGEWIDKYVWEMDPIVGRNWRHKFFGQVDYMQYSGNIDKINQIDEINEINKIIKFENLGKNQGCVDVSNNNERINSQVKSIFEDKNQSIHQENGCNLGYNTEYYNANQVKLQMELKSSTLLERKKVNVYVPQKYLKSNVIHCIDKVTLHVNTLITIIKIKCSNGLIIPIYKQVNSELYIYLDKIETETETETETEINNIFMEQVEYSINNRTYFYTLNCKVNFIRGKKVIIVDSKNFISLKNDNRVYVRFYYQRVKYRLGSGSDNFMEEVDGDYLCVYKDCKEVGANVLGIYFDVSDDFYQYEEFKYEVFD